MPNWCRNEVRFNLVSTRSAELVIEAILDYVKESIANFDRRVRNKNKIDDDNKINIWTREVMHRRLFDFESLVPYPEEFRIRDDDAELLSKEDFLAKYGNNLNGYNSGGHEWCLKNWGTKWNASDVVWVPQQKTFYFDTAWGPATKIISELHKRFPEVYICFEYYERGSAFIGGCEFIPEEDWYPADNTAEEVYSIEQRMKRDGVPPETKWEAGKAYNPWSMDYMGFKGG